MDLKEAIQSLGNVITEAVPGPGVEAGIKAYVKIGNDAIKRSQFSQLYRDRQGHFEFDKKTKYYGIWNMEFGKQSSIHAFVDIVTGDLLKAAGWKKPAKGARGNVADADFMASLPARFDVHGGHLYRIKV